MVKDENRILLLSCTFLLTNEADILFLFYLSLLCIAPLAKNLEGNRLIRLSLANRFL